MKSNRIKQQKHIKSISTQKYSIGEYIASIPYVLVLYPVAIKENMASKS